MIPALIHAPGERYVLAHRVPFLQAGTSTVTGCRLPIGPDWQGLPPDLTTPICTGCSAAPAEAPPEPEESAPTVPVPVVPVLSEQEEARPEEEDAPEPVEPVSVRHEPAQPQRKEKPAPYKATVWRLLSHLLRGHH